MILIKKERRVIKMSLNFSQYVVRKNDGSVNKKETAAKFSRELNEWIEQSKHNKDATRNAVLATLKKNQKLTFDALVSAVMVELGCTPTAHTTIKERVKSVVADTSTFERARGRNGGFTLKTEETAQAAE